MVYPGIAAARCGTLYNSREDACGWILPAYAPELNPVEYLWSYWKQHELPNFAPPRSGT